MLAERLRITRADASRRIHEAADLEPRRAMTGEPLDPVLTATAEAQRSGRVGSGHVRVIRELLNQLPGDVDLETRQQAEVRLAKRGAEFRPDQLGKLADCTNPDGTFTDEDRVRRRGVSIGNQGADGRSPITGYLTPEVRAGCDAVLAKPAGPGVCNPADASACVSGSPSQDAVDDDTRSAAQRNHDALGALLRSALSSGELAQHNALPATIIVSTTLAELESGCGKEITGGGTSLPMHDVIRLASQAHHYLCIFDKGKAIGLYHTKRLASAGHPMVLYGKDRGCSFPNCDVPGYLTEVHHATDFAECRETYIDDLTQACGPHHKLVTSGGWTTRKRKDGTTEWLPPPHLDRGQPRINRFHHPETLLRVDEDDDGPLRGRSSAANRIYSRLESFPASRRFTGSGSRPVTSPPSIATSLASDDDTKE